MYCIEVHSGKSLAELLKAFPKAEVRTLISEPNQDCWRVSFDVEDVVTKEDDNPNHNPNGDRMKPLVTFPELVEQLYPKPSG